MTNLERAKAYLMAYETPNQNCIVSPASLDMALGLVNEAGSEVVRSELNALLGTTDYAVTACSTIDRSEDVSSSMRSQLRFANSLWVNNEYTLRPSFVGVAKSHYDAEVAPVDVRDSVEVANLINSWCAEKTCGLIPQIVSPDNINEGLAMLLCSSLYFKDKWRSIFAVDSGKFTLEDGTVQELDEFLYTDDATYMWAETAEAFGKEYKSGIKFIGILPAVGVGLEGIDFDALLASETTRYEVHASMPKLDYEFTCQGLIEMLKSLGIKALFDSGLGGLNKLVKESESVSVSGIVQKCRIILDEEETEAAAVTEMECCFDGCALDFDEPMSVIKEVHLDRPFYYLIVDSFSNQVLFAGSVKEPF